MAKRQISSKENLPPAKHRTRFNFDVSDDDFEEYSRGFVTPATAQDTQKCVNLFQEWRRERNSHFPDEEIPENILLCGNKALLCKWLC